MRIPYGLIFIVALIVGIAWLAPDSKLGGDLRNTGSDAASATGSLLGAFSRGAKEASDIVSE